MYQTRLSTDPHATLEVGVKVGKVGIPKEMISNLNPDKIKDIG